MVDQLQKLEKRYEELEQILASYENISDKDQYNKFAKELADLRGPVSLFREYKKIISEIEDTQKVLSEKHDKEFSELAKSELEELFLRKTAIEDNLERILTGEDKDANRDIIVEIRPGTGGMEAALFVGDLYRMYTKYAANKNWSLDPMAVASTELGGFKEVVFGLKGKDVYKRLKFESGVHRVQRVPETEAQGRIHTSTASVVVMPEVEEVDLVIEPKDLRIDTYRSSGPGGQHMQKTDSAVRITYIPTGTAVACQDERSQIKNKAKAMRILRARLLDMKEQAEAKKITEARRTQIGSGDRSEKIRTYNFPDRRVTDHRINFTSHQLEAILEGELDEISDALIKASEEKARQEKQAKE
ncbi:MAG: peptide chain release factor 1 [Candidatus Omnitrophica bacterium]|jgi:peptide chain release factor 1|nr:peptide chain release factor 1 [Candidatus Omnitrophota bacterium]